jgi:hypothetical protein
MSTIKITNTKRGTPDYWTIVSRPSAPRTVPSHTAHYSVPKDSTTIPLCDAVLRFESALRVAANFPGKIG